MIEKSKLSKQSLVELAKEIEICKDLDHPNIVKIYESYEDQKYLYIVTELITGGELLQEIFRRKKLSEKDCASVIKQVLEALNYLHINQVAHKDMKPENILLEIQFDLESIKLIDFGAAQKFDKSK